MRVLFPARVTVSQLFAVGCAQNVKTEERVKDKAAVGERAVGRESESERGDTTRAPQTVRRCFIYIQCTVRVRVPRAWLTDRPVGEILLLRCRRRSNILLLNY